MSQLTLALPVSVEQIAAVIKQMGQDEQRQLLKLVPELATVAKELPAPSTEQEPAFLTELRAQVLAALDNKPLSPDEPFLGELTIGQYMSLSDKEQADLWDELGGIDLMDMEEIEVSPDAVFA